MAPPSNSTVPQFTEADRLFARTVHFTIEQLSQCESETFAPISYSDKVAFVCNILRRAGQSPPPTEVVRQLESMRESEFKDQFALDINTDGDRWLKEKLFTFYQTRHRNEAYGDYLKLLLAPCTQVSQEEVKEIVNEKILIPLKVICIQEKARQYIETNFAKLKGAIEETDDTKETFFSVLYGGIIQNDLNGYINDSSQLDLLGAFLSELNLFRHDITPHCTLSEFNYYKNASKPQMNYSHYRLRVPDVLRRLAVIPLKPSKLYGGRRSGRTTTAALLFRELGHLYHQETHYPSKRTPAMAHYFGQLLQRKALLVCLAECTDSLAPVSERKNSNLFLKQAIAPPRPLWHQKKSKGNILSRIFQMMPTVSLVMLPFALFSSLDVLLITDSNTILPTNVHTPGIATSEPETISWYSPLGIIAWFALLVIICVLLYCQQRFSSSK